MIFKNLLVRQFVSTCECCNISLVCIDFDLEFMYSYNINFKFSAYFPVFLLTVSCCWVLIVMNLGVASDSHKCWVSEELF